MEAHGHVHIIARIENGRNLRVNSQGYKYPEGPYQGAAMDHWHMESTFSPENIYIYAYRPI